MTYVACPLVETRYGGCNLYSALQIHAGKCPPCVRTQYTETEKVPQYSFKKCMIKYFFSMQMSMAH